MEVRREALNKAFGAQSGTGIRSASNQHASAGSGNGADKHAAGTSDSATGAKGLTDISHVLFLERQIESLQTEIIDMQRAIVKVQSWFRMRASAFQGACMRELAAAQRRAKHAESMRWEERGAAERTMEALHLQLRATQVCQRPMMATASTQH